MNKIFILIAAVLITGCSSSLVFSPSVNLPVTTLKKGEFDVQASAEFFPETRPDNVGSKTSIGGHLLLGYGLSDKHSIHGKGWLDFDNKGMYATRSGFSINMVNQLWQFNTRTKLLLLPKIGMVLDGKHRGGYGAELPVILHYHYQKNISVYSGFGFIYGLVDFEKKEIHNRSELQSGFGITHHLGTSIFLYRKLRLNAELTTLYQNNNFEDRSHLIFSPTIGIGFTF